VQKKNPDLKSGLHRVNLFTYLNNHITTPFHFPEEMKKRIAKKHTTGIHCFFNNFE
jgi:hypothetical protein